VTRALLLRSRHALVGLCGLALFAFTPAARADDKECMTAASKGQEARDQSRLVEARSLFQKCAQSSCPAPIPKYCGEWLADLNKKMPTIVLRVEDQNGRDVTDATAMIDSQAVTLDGRAVDVDPGKHHVRITRAGAKPFETDIVVAQSEKDRVIVGKLAPDGPADTTKPAPATPDGPRSGVPLASWIGWGVGAAGLASFSIFGLKARLDYDDYESTCGQRCTTSDRDSVQTSVTIADISLVIGLVGVAVGTYFYLTRPQANASTKNAALAPSPKRLSPFFEVR